jgi:hypothetical protein
MVSTKILAWKARQKRGAIMEPKTFSYIVAAAKKRGYKNPQAVAGKAYWVAVKAKYKTK